MDKRVNASKLVVLAMSIAIVVAGCSGTTAGVSDVTPDEPTPEPYAAPKSDNALLFSLPQTIGGIPLMVPSPASIRDDIDEFASDHVVWQELVDRGLGDADVHLAQRSDKLDTNPDDLPALAVSALRVEGLPASRFVDLDASFYFVLTTANGDDYRWDSAKPSPELRNVGGRNVYYAEFESVDVAWYPRGEVLYIIMTGNPQLMASALVQMPQSNELAAAL